MRQSIILFAVVCVLACLVGINAECCRSSLTISYTIRGTCADAGGRSSGSRCTITICADGKAQVGTYCGRRSCNIFGCNCGGGCIRGEWQRSFVENNRGRNVQVLGTRWNS